MPFPRQKTLLVLILGQLLIALAAEATELGFGEMYQFPIGAHGLRPTAKLLALDGHQVRLHGYVAREEQPLPGRLILVPVPVLLAGEDEALADDLPANAVFVHWPEGGFAPPASGHLGLTGTLRVGAAEEVDGRLSMIRLDLDAPPARHASGMQR